MTYEGTEADKRYTELLHELQKRLGEEGREGLVSELDEWVGRRLVEAEDGAALHTVGYKQTEVDRAWDRASDALEEAGVSHTLREQVHEAAMHKVIQAEQGQDHLRYLITLCAERLNAQQVGEVAMFAHKLAERP